MDQRLINKHIYKDKAMDRKADYINHQLNTSNFRYTFRFSKAQRFLNPKTQHTDFNYYVAPRRSSRSASFGIGNRPNQQNLNYYPGPDRYNVSKFPVDQRGTSLSCSREKNIFGSLAHQIERKIQLPSPDTYNNVERKGKSFSLGMKLPGEADFVVKKRVPGPGQYQALQITPTGRYISSRNRNTRNISFGVPATGRPSTTDNTRTGPGSYDIYNADSNFSDTKVSLMKHNTVKKFGTGKRKEFEDKSKVDVPGPGQYQPFSCFGNGFKPRVS